MGLLKRFNITAIEPKGGRLVQVHNMLEKVGQSYKAGNIRVIKIKPEMIEVYKRGGELLKYKRMKE